MLSVQENEVLTQVSKGTPMGDLMRQHWTPVCLSEEVTERDGTPLLVEALGMRMVAFRNTKGELGLLDERCPHRLASLVLGRNEDCGLRCLYHGWKFDVAGNVVAMSSEPEGSPLMSKVKHRAYPTVEAAGFVWVWLGDPEAVPEFQPPAFCPTGTERVSILKIRIPANWAQMTEGQIDSAHSSSLHSSDMVPARVDSAGATDSKWLRPSTDKSPRMQAATTDYGFQYVAIRRPIKQAATHDYLRITQYIAPYTSLIPPNSSYKVATVIVPVDDSASMFHFIAWGDPEDTPDTQSWRAFASAVPGEDLDPVTWATYGTMENRFRQDRGLMKEGNFTGIKGIPNQDIAMWVSMGTIVDRSDDVLGASDIAIVEFRRLMVDAAIAMANGAPALGTACRLPQAQIASYQGVVPKGSDWRAIWQTPAP
ncbi:Rieske 2Fe-2S domain-containing protein [Pararhodobacter oceanensis]|uniref:Rieske 2Fe-2S domain-containing protein n=1 Tax=Pararhodobacter oceanensis TaxID=2172121 RepID=UPI003A8CFC41